MGLIMLIVWIVIYIVLIKILRKKQIKNKGDDMNAGNNWFCTKWSYGNRCLFCNGFFLFLYHDKSNYLYLQYNRQSKEF